MKQKIQKHKHDAPEKLDLFRDTFRGKMPLTDDYVFHASPGQDTAESKGALMEILNIILARKQGSDPPSSSNQSRRNGKWKGTVMDIKAETDAGELLHRNAGKLLQLLSRVSALFLWRQTGEFFVAGLAKNMIR